MRRPAAALVGIELHLDLQLLLIPQLQLPLVLAALGQLTAQLMV